jgi:hypothetical protein
MFIHSPLELQATELTVVTAMIKMNSRLFQQILCIKVFTYKCSKYGPKAQLYLLAKETNVLYYLLVFVGMFAEFVLKRSCHRSVRMK